MSRSHFDELATLRERNQDLLRQLHHQRHSMNLVSQHATAIQHEKPHITRPIRPRRSSTPRSALKRRPLRDVLIQDVNTTPDMRPYHLRNRTPDLRKHNVSFKKDLVESSFIDDVDENASKRPASTPVRNTKYSVLDTPKSILKKRRLIENNVKVDSRFDHGADWERKSKKSRLDLNYSYSGVDDDISPKEYMQSLYSPVGSPRQLRRDRVRLSPQHDLWSLSPKKSPFKYYTTPQERAHINKRLSRPRSPYYTRSKERLKARSRLADRSMAKSTMSQSPPRMTDQIRTQSSFANRSLAQSDLPSETSFRQSDSIRSAQSPYFTRSKGNRADLVFASGNERQPVMQLTPKPKSVLMTTGLKTQSPKKSRVSVRTSLDDSVRMVDGKEEQPLLGYDWIAGLLDNEPSTVERSEAYFEALRDFRRVNKNECMSKSYQEVDIEDATQSSQSPEIKSPDHTCIHTYYVNNRLFPVALNADEAGRSQCPICNNLRRKPTSESPGYVRVSIPRSTLLTPYRVKPHRRKSFDPTDSYALSEHCLAGWQSSRPSMLPAASNMDIKQAADGLRAKLSTTMAEAERMISEDRRRLEERADRLRPLHMVTRSQHRANTEDLLNMSHGLRYELQKLEQERNLTKHNPPHTTAFPLY